MKKSKGKEMKSRRKRTKDVRAATESGDGEKSLAWSDFTSDSLRTTNLASHV